MLIDSELVFSDAQALTGDAVSTNVVNLLAAKRAPGNPLHVFAQIDETFDNLTTLEFQVQSCAVEGFGSGVVTHQKVSIALAALVAGKKIDLGSLLEGTLQYVRINYDVTGTNPSAGQVTALLAPFGHHTLPGQE
jgi:hypothetical protein